MDEKNLPPAHKVEPYKIKLEGKKLSLQYEKSFFDDLMNEEGCIALAPTEAIDNVLLNRRQAWQRMLSPSLFTSAMAPSAAINFQKDVGWQHSG